MRSPLPASSSATGRAAAPGIGRRRSRSADRVEGLPFPCRLVGRVPLGAGRRVPLRGRRWAPPPRRAAPTDGRSGRPASDAISTRERPDFPIGMDETRIAGSRGDVGRAGCASRSHSRRQPWVEGGGFGASPLSCPWRSRRSGTRRPIGLEMPQFARSGISPCRAFRPVGRAASLPVGALLDAVSRVTLGRPGQGSTPPVPGGNGMASSSSSVRYGLSLLSRTDQCGVWRLI